LIVAITNLAILPPVEEPKLKLIGSMEWKLEEANLPDENEGRLI
jgi:hypothetical protein